MDAVATTLHIKRLDASSYFIPCVLARAMVVLGLASMDKRSSCRAPPLFSHQKRCGSVGVVRVGCLLEGKMLEATALPLESEFF